MDPQDLPLTTPAQWLDRANRLERWGRHADAADAFRQALSAADDTLRYPALLGISRSLAKLGNQVEATRTCRRAIGLGPDQVEGHAWLALLQMDAGDLSAAAASAECARRFGPDSPDLHCLTATIALKLGRMSDAALAAGQALRCAPGNQRAKALRALTGTELPASDLSALVRIAMPPPPPGFASIRAFNSSLAAVVESHEALDRACHASPLVHGARLHDISDLPVHLWQALVFMFREAALACADLAREPFAVRGWANVMTAGAFEKPHIHEGGRLSGVYYPRLPASGGRGGALMFGQHDLGDAVPHLQTFRIEPAEGMLVLFPSWLYHSTEPFRAEGLRISVAADLS